MPKTKYVRFNLYKAVVSLATGYYDRKNLVESKLDDFLQSNPENWKYNERKRHSRWSAHKEEIERCAEQANTSWQLGEVIEAAVNRVIPELVMTVGGESVELDVNAYYHSEDASYLHSFQLTRLRATGLPAKKKIGQERVDIPLENDEYIGEFTEVLIDTRYDVISIQSNKYGVGVSIIQKYLNFLQKQYNEIRNRPLARYVIGELKPLIDEKLTELALNSTCYKKLKLRCSDVNMEGIIPRNNVRLSSVPNIIGNQTGVIMELSLSIKKDSVTPSLTPDDVRAVAEQYRNYINDPTVSEADKKDAQIEITFLNRETDTLEAVDMLIPKVNFYVPIELEDRQPIISQHLYDLTVERYGRIVGKLQAILGGVE